MDFVPIETLVELTGKTRRTIDRKMQALKTSDPKKYGEFIKAEDKRILYHAERILGYLSSTAVIKKPKEYKPTSARKPKPKSQAGRDREKIISDTASQNVQPDLSILSEPELINLDDEVKRHYANMDAGDRRRMQFMLSAMNDYATGLYSLRETLSNHSIPSPTFYAWINNKPVFNDLYAKAEMKHRKNYNTHLQDQAKQSLSKMVTGYEKTLEAVVYSQKVAPTGETINIPIEKKVQTKYILPNANLIMFALTNRDPDEWKRTINPWNQQQAPQADPLESMSDQELDNFLNSAKQQGLISSGDSSQSAQV